MSIAATVSPAYDGRHCTQGQEARRCSRRKCCAGEFALEVPLKAAFFNDAGGGKDGAGIAALAMLQARGVAGGTVAHTSARIGDSLDTWECGVISNLNESARRLGLAVGESLRGALQRLVAG